MNINKRVVAAIAAVALAVLGVIALVAYTNDARERAFEGTELVPVVQVVSPVAAGTKAEDLGNAVETVKLPRASVPETALADLDPIAGQVATAALVPGEVLVAGRFGTKDEVNGGEKITVPKGMQEITIQLKSVRALGGKLRPGDFVGVAASYDGNAGTNFAFNRALVLSSTSPGQVADGQSADEIVVHLAISWLNAEKVVHATEFGRVYLTRQGEDATIDRRQIFADDVVR